MILVLDHLTGLGPGSELTLRNDKLGSRWLGPVSPSTRHNCVLQNIITAHCPRPDLGLVSMTGIWSDLSEYCLNMDSDDYNTIHN